MSTKHNIMSSDRSADTEERASDWLIRRDSGHWTQVEQSQLHQWLDASTENRVAFLRLELAWEECARLKALGAGVPGDEPPPPGRWNITPFFDSPRPAVVRTRGWRFAVAASVLLAVLVGVGGYRLQGHGTDRYVTPVGGRASVPMIDGSKITLNTNSQLRVALTATLRRVDLHQGEAFFEVAKDGQRPFWVAAGKKRIVAVGTKFSVRRDGDDIEVIVTEGKVRVEDNAPESRTVFAASARPPVLLTPGAIARAGDAGVLVERISMQEAETHLSWRGGVLMFRDQSLAAAAAEFNSYNVRQIVIDDAAVGALKLEGNFTATNVDGFVRLIESGFPVRATLHDDRIVLSSR
jgi:transmembrane sensor